MPQNNLNYQSNSPTNVPTPSQLDATGNLLIGVGSVSKYNVTAAAVIKTGPGRISKIINNAGTAGFTINDCATTGAAAAANAIMVISTTTVGQIISLDTPFATGLVVSVVGASGVLTIVYD